MSKGGEKARRRSSPFWERQDPARPFSWRSLYERWFLLASRRFPDSESTSKSDRSRTLAVLAPTNKAASVLRNRGIPATTIHRIMYTPEYDPEYERITAWLEGKEKRPKTALVGDSILKRVQAFYQVSPSVPAAFAAAGISDGGVHQGLDASRRALGYRICR